MHSFVRLRLTAQSDCNLRKGFLSSASFFEIHSLLVHIEPTLPRQQTLIWILFLNNDTYICKKRYTNK